MTDIAEAAQQLKQDPLLQDASSDEYFREMFSNLPGETDAQALTRLRAEMQGKHNPLEAA